MSGAWIICTIISNGFDGTMDQNREEVDYNGIEQREWLIRQSLCLPPTFTIRRYLDLFFTLLSSSVSTPGASNTTGKGSRRSDKACDGTPRSYMEYAFIDNRAWW